MTARLLSIPEAAEVLNVPVSWLRDKVTARQVPHTRIGRHVRFTAEHLAAIVAAGEQQVRARPPVQLRIAPTGRGRPHRRHP